MSVLGISANRRTRRTRRLGLAGALLVAGTVLTACANPLGAGVVVGSSSVSETTIQTESAQVVAENADDTTLTDQVLTTRTVATAAVNHQLVQAAAAASGVSVDEAELNATLAQLSGNEAQLAALFKIPLANVEQTVRDLLTQQAILRASDGGVPVTDVTVTFDVVGAASRDEAVAKRVQYLADPGKLTADAAGAGSSGGGVNQKTNLLAAPSLGPTGLFAAGVGDVVIFPLDQQWYVARITDRTPAPARLTLESQPQTAEQQLAFFNLVLQSFGEQTSVQVNPRYGTWDPLSMAVVPGGSGV